MGANVDIRDFPGYAPLINDKYLIEVAKEAAQLALPEEMFSIMDSMWSASTDMGDISSVMPAVHPFIPGIEGGLHNADFRVVDAEKACVGSAKFQLAMVYLLMSNRAKRAMQVIKASKPYFANKTEYFKYIDSLACEGDRIEYSFDSNVKVNLN